MNKQVFRSLIPVLVALALGVSSASGAATITILNNDAAGVGFNDTTAVAPVGGNPGTTLGQQRLIAFQAAANKWGATLSSAVTITIRAQWTALSCTSTAATLGSAGAIQIFRDFPGAPFTGTWYNESLTGKFFGSDPDPATPEINANFNVNLGKPGCLDGTFFYLGLDNNHGTNIDLVTVLTHEFGHGLGFQTFTSNSTGAFNGGFPSIFDRFLVDDGNGKSWLNMTNGERQASAINTHKLAWNGPQVQTDVPNVLAFGIPVVKINSPAGIAGNYDAATVSFGPLPTAGGVTASVVQALDPADAAGPSTTDGCEPFTNAAAVAGNIAIVDRGTCTAKTKALNAQNAGAIGLIVVNNVAGSPAPGFADDASITTTITIPTVVLTQSDGQLIEAQVGTGVNGTIKLDTTVRAGADQFGKALLNAPNPVVAGSSVSHYDTIAFPNQLMEPNINGDLTHEVTPPNDLTFSEMTDVGWVATSLPNSIAKTTGDNQNATLNQPFLLPLTVTVSPPVSGITVTWTVNPSGTGAGATFPSTNNRIATSTTNAGGVAVAPPLSANGVPGFYSMNATAPGAGTATFNLQNNPVPVAGSACATDTTQADFQGGVTNKTDVTSNPGNVILLAPLTDQQNQTLSASGNAISDVGWSGQTFVPGLTGQLTRADINLFCSGCTGTAPTVTVSVRATDGSGLPTGADLAAVTFPTSTSGAGAYFTANFTTPAAVTAGTKYALVVRNATNPSVGVNAITRSATDVYAPGSRVTSADSGGTWTAPLTSGSTTDLGFITYINATATSGDFISSVKDSNPPMAGLSLWSTMSWNATVPPGQHVAVPGCGQ